MTSRKSNILLIVSNPYALNSIFETFEQLASKHKIFVIVSDNFLKGRYKKDLLKMQDRFEVLHILNLYRTDGRKKINAKFNEMFFIYNFIRKYKNIKFQLIFSHSSQEMYEYLLIKFFSRFSTYSVCLWPLTLNVADLNKVVRKPSYLKFLKDSPKYLFNKLSSFFIFYTNKILFKILFNLDTDSWHKKSLIGTWTFDYILCTNNQIRDLIHKNFSHKNILLANFNFSSYNSKSLVTNHTALVNFGLYDKQEFKIVDTLLKIQRQLKIDNYIIRFHPRQPRIDFIVKDLKNSTLENLRFSVSQDNPLHIDFLKVDFFISEPSSSLFFALGYFPIDRIFGIMNEATKSRYHWVLNQFEENVNWTTNNPESLLCNAIALNNHHKLIDIIEGVLLKYEK